MAGRTTRTGSLMPGVADAHHSAIVRARNIARYFGDRIALTGINIDIDPGQIFGLLGPDGSGKTTLLQILAAILDPTEGACTVMGFDTQHEDYEVNARVGYMSQGFTLYELLSVEENLRFAARIRGVTRAEYETRSKRLLSMAGLTEFRSRRAEKLSGGMRKKLSLSCSLIHEPDLLLLDELSLGVDPLSRRELWDMLRIFRDEGVTVVISTPYMGEAENCDALCFLQEGRVLAEDAPAAMRERARGTVYELAGVDPAQVAAAINNAPEVADITSDEGVVRIRTFDAEGLRPETAAKFDTLGDIYPAVPSMEDAFLYLSQRGVGVGAGAGHYPAGVQPGNNLRGNEREKAVVLTEISRSFGRFVALDKVTLTVNRGDIFGFLGPNGAGKTTLIRILCGMLAPTAGSATVAGIDVTRHARRLANRIGYMSQQFSLYPDLTCAENLEFFGGVYGLAGRKKRNAIQRAVETLELGESMHQTVAQLSGAVRQRLALACSILHGPDVLFLDEPTSGIDPASRLRFWQLIKAQAESGITIFVTTHYLDEATNCDRIGLLSRGRLLAEGTLAQLREGLGAPHDASIEEVFMDYVLRSQRAAEAVS